MTTSTTIKEFAAAFAKAQATMQGAAKDARNSHFNSSYSDFASVVGAVRGPLTDNGIGFLQLPKLTAEGVEIETILLHSSGEWIGNTLAIPVTKRDAHGVGSAISYGKRYGLQAICGLPSEDDDGNAATGDVSKSDRRPAPRQPQRSAPPASENAAPKPPIGFDPFKALSEEAQDFLVNCWDVKVSQRNHSIEAGRAYLAAVLLQKKMQSVNQIKPDDQIVLIQKLEKGELDTGLVKHEAPSKAVA